MTLFTKKIPMTYDDGTMDVYVNGKLERRKYHIKIGHRSWIDRHTPDRPYPELKDDEDAIFVVSSDIPHIIKVRK